MTDPDPRTVRADDKLLDRLGHGQPAHGGDAEDMLAGWRSGLPAAGPADPRLVDAVTAAVTPVARPRRLARASLGVAATFVLVGGGLTVAAAYAGPDSPLWPVTRLVYGNLAASRIASADAGRAVSDARTAANAHRYPEAARLLATADALTDKVVEVDDARRLRAAITEVRGLLPDGSDAPAGAPAVPDPTESLGVETPPLAPDERPTPGPKHGNGWHGDDDRGDNHHGDNDRGDRGRDADEDEKPDKWKPGERPHVDLPEPPAVPLPVEPPGH
jgi:hypothetical protein